MGVGSFVFWGGTSVCSSGTGESREDRKEQRDETKIDGMLPVVGHHAALLEQAVVGASKAPPVGIRRLRGVVAEDTGHKELQNVLGRQAPIRREQPAFAPFGGTFFGHVCGTLLGRRPTACPGDLRIAVGNLRGHRRPDTGKTGQHKYDERDQEARPDGEDFRFYIVDFRFRSGTCRLPIADCRLRGTRRLHARV